MNVDPSNLMIQIINMLMSERLRVGIDDADRASRYKQVAKETVTGHTTTLPAVALPALALKSHALAINVERIGSCLGWC